MTSPEPGAPVPVPAPLPAGLPADLGTLRLAAPEPGVLVLTLDRPERLNAMSADLLRELHAVLDALADDPSVRVLVLTGAGRGFCAGLDLTAFDMGGPDRATRSPQAGLALQKHIAALVPKLRALPQVVIAAVNGPAAGGGLALALAADVRIGAASSRYTVAFVRLGLSGCDIGVSWLLPRLIGASRAFELLLTGRVVDAPEADRIGLVTRVVPDEELLDAALGTARAVLANSPMGVRMTKEVMWSQLEVSSLQAGIDLENRTQILSSFTGDHREAALAFRERRSPHFRDA
ncbi:enoyl-CoA hydratase/isomerase family protein [Geodermatophilus marinus]|uniref:enoyl-CoA hydratase/isomerase family protein n=1 Tax=Geodermatophilus sp. LHW52908 TaxID=2303986 RepID=UPI000E3D7DDA|nr:enoyl-CoA hydratase-related protein [Geodermatophilus sp. LHW52908]RFU21499.1 enoyl-CoA hydratase/isomerase family protein [Geodermatophilus sp. LHW52908]